MTKFLIHKFIPRDAKQSTKDRQRYGVLSGIVGILCNLLLCVLEIYLRDGEPLGVYHRRRRQ